MAIISNIPVQVIASCSIGGEFTPIRFRYEALDCSLITVDVLSVDNRKHKFTNYAHEMNYDCRGSVDGVIKRFRLRYYIPGHNWTLTLIE